MAIGEHIRDLRWDAHLKQVELARRAGIAQNTLSQIELGNTVPSVRTLEKIAHGLGVEASDLLERPPVPLAEAPEAGRLEEEPSPAVEVQERREPGVKTASAHIHGQGSLRAEGTVLRIASPDLQAIIRGAVRGELSEEEAMAAAHEKAETV
jgi:transcriptional regulator with XRE-family HTH domain